MQNETINKAEMQKDMHNLTDKAASLVQAAKKAGATASDASIVRSRSYGISVRLQKVEETEASESDDFSLRVFVGKRVASVSASLNSDLDDLAERAVLMAKASPENPFEGEVASEQLVKTPRDLDLFDGYIPTTDDLTKDAMTAEQAALAIKGVENSGGASASYGVGGLALATSHGFADSYVASYFGRSVSAVAGHGVGLERDYDYSTALHHEDLDEAEEIGKNAGSRAVARLNAQQAETGQVDVIFAPRVARSLAGHLSSMINGASIARKTGLLRSYMGKRIMREGMQVTDNPLRLRGAASRPFDSEGVEPLPLAPIENGVLQDWLLSSSVAKELGLQTNGRGSRSGNSIVPASTNFAIEAGEQTPQDLIAGLKKGFYVTELVGHGVDLTTGQYSRGASGFWIENGVFSHPVSEVTLGSNLLDMFAHMTAADDLDRRFATAAPTLLVENMTLAGK